MPPDVQLILQQTATPAPHVSKKHAEVTWATAAVVSAISWSACHNGVSLSVSN
jgi:hypothetical protein